jgi:hypothetical protein
MKFDISQRFGIKINTGHNALGDAVIRISFQYRTYGTAEDWGATMLNPQPSKVLKIGCRKILDDSFVPIAEYPIQFEPLKAGLIQSATVQGHNNYNLVAGDNVVFEMIPNANGSIELPVSTTEAFPTNTQSQVFVSSWSNTTSNRPLAVAITSKVLTPV